MPYVTKRSVALLVSLGLIVGLLAPAVATAKSVLPQYTAIPAPASVRNATPAEAPIDPASIAAAKTAQAADPNPVYTLGDPVIGIRYNSTAPNPYGLTFYHVRAIGEHIEVWVADNLAWPAGDPRATPVVTDAQIAYLVDQFDNNIYPKESAFFRTPDVHDGSNSSIAPLLGDPTAFQNADGSAKTIAMISNIRDENYFDPTYPNYIGGFYSSTVEGYLDRNVISIDAYDWANRVGGADAPWRPNDGTANDRNHGYEGTFAHEYEHLLMDDTDSEEVNWVDEGIADWAIKLVGYGLDAGHVNEAQTLAENSLTQWEDQGGLEVLADYGEALLFFQYVYGLYGQDAIHAIFHNTEESIAGFNAAMADLGINKTFAELYHDFAIARLVNGKTTGPAAGVSSIPDLWTGIHLFNADGSINTETYSTPGAPPWGSDYVVLGDSKSIKSIKFNGVDELVRSTAWTSVADPIDDHGQVLWSGTGDEQSRFAIFETNGGGTLSFDTLYDLEEQWDFGIVQVSTDNGATWTSLANADTRSDIVPEGYPAIKDNLPGFTGVTGTLAAPAWEHESFDLSAFSGPILVGFRFMSDWGTNGNGALDNPNWYVDNVMVDGTSISDGSNASAFKDVTFYQPIPSNFHVDIVAYGANGKARVFPLITNDANEESAPFALRKALKDGGYAVAVVTYDAPDGVADYAPYTLEVLR